MVVLALQMTKWSGSWFPAVVWLIGNVRKRGQVRGLAPSPLFDSFLRCSDRPKFAEVEEEGDGFSPQLLGQASLTSDALIGWSQTRSYDLMGGE